MKKLLLTVVLVVISLVGYSQVENPLTLYLTKEEIKVQLNKLALDNCLIQIEQMDKGAKIKKEDLFWHKISDNGDNIIYQDNYLSIKYDINYEDIAYKITLSYKDVTMGIEKFTQLLKGFKLYDKTHRVYTNNEEIFVRIVHPNRISITEYYTLD